MPADDELVTWVANLRERLQRGDVDRLDADGDTRDPAIVSRALLAELDRLGSLPRDERHTPDTVARRIALLDDFRRLREQIG